MARTAFSWILGLIGAALGGVLGYFAFFWILKQGFYALVLPGAAIGLGCGLLSRHDSVVRGIFCGLAGLALALYLEWNIAPFKADNSLVYFLTHCYTLEPITLIMIALGGLLAVWFGKTSFVRGGSDEQTPA